MTAASWGATVDALATRLAASDAPSFTTEVNNLLANLNDPGAPAVAADLITRLSVAKSISRRNALESAAIEKVLLGVPGSSGVQAQLATLQVQINLDDAVHRALFGMVPDLGGGASRSSLSYGFYNPTVPIAGMGIPVGNLPGVGLTVYGGGTMSTTVNYTASANNEVIQNLEIFGTIFLNGKSNVVIRNCRAWGTLAIGTQMAFVNGGTVSSPSDDLHGALIEDCEFFGRGNWFMEGGRGCNYTINRTEINGAVDGIGLMKLPGNVTVQGNWIHNGMYGEWTQAEETAGIREKQAAFYTHDDAIQFHIGKDYLIRGNFLGGVRAPYNHHTGHLAEIIAADDCFNSAILLLQEVNNSAANKLERITIDRNWLWGGVCTLNITSPPADASGPKNMFESVDITNNRFPRSTWGSGQLYILRQSTGGPLLLNMSGNVFDDDNTLVPIGNGG